MLGLARARVGVGFLHAGLRAQRVRVGVRVGVRVRVRVTLTAAHSCASLW